MERQNHLRSPCAIQQARLTPRALAAFFVDESAQDIVEYALIAVLIGLGTVVATRNLAASIGVAFSNVRTALTSSV
jgi:pilus assembly protein Flp/PilA